MKTKHAVAIADGGRGEVRFLGEVANTPAAVERLTRKLAGRYDRRHICYEAGPTGYGLYRQFRGSRAWPSGGRAGLDPEAGGRAGQPTGGMR